MTKKSVKNKIKLAVITGGHPYDPINFQEVFRSIPEIDYYPQHLEDFVFRGHLPGLEDDEWLWNGAGEVRKQYDVLLFYNMTRQLKGPETLTRNDEHIEPTLTETLGETGQGIFVLHHAILAFPEWKLWSDMVGIQDRSFSTPHGLSHDIKFRIDVANKEHPITKGLKAYELVDETYVMNDASEGSEILLTTDYPYSMKTIAWTRKYKKAKVFCYQNGHDKKVFANPNFRNIVARGILWLADRI